jgi:hypothetical protein
MQLIANVTIIRVDVLGRILLQELVQDVWRIIYWMRVLGIALSYLIHRRILVMLLNRNCLLSQPMLMLIVSS